MDSVVRGLRYQSTQRAGFSEGIETKGIYGTRPVFQSAIEVE